MGSIQLTTSIVMIILFSIAILGFATQFAVDNDAAISVADDPELSLMQTNLQSNGSSFTSESENTYSSIINSTISPGSDVIPSTAVFSLTPSSLVKVLKTITYSSYQKVFGSDSGFAIFFVTFIAIIVLLFALYVYKTLKGNPD